MNLQVSEIQRLNKVKFEYELVLTEEKIKSVSNLVDCTPIKVEGVASDFSNDMIMLDATLSGTFTIPCANTGKLVKQEFNFESQIMISLSDELNDGDIILKGNVIDLDDILFTEIAVNVPLVKTEEIKEVDNEQWAVMKKEKTYNPFADLKDKI